MTKTKSDKKIKNTKSVIKTNKKQKKCHKK